MLTPRGNRGFRQVGRPLCSTILCVVALLSVSAAPSAWAQAAGGGDLPTAEAQSHINWAVREYLRLNAGPCSKGDYNRARTDCYGAANDPCVGSGWARESGCCVRPCLDGYSLSNGKCIEGCPATGQDTNCGLFCAESTAACVSEGISKALTVFEVVANIAGAVLTGGTSSVANSARQAAVRGGRLAGRSVIQSAVQGARSRLSAQLRERLGARLLNAIRTRQASRQLREDYADFVFDGASDALLQAAIDRASPGVLDVVGILDPTGVIAMIDAFNDPTCFETPVPMSVGGWSTPFSEEHGGQACGAGFAVNGLTCYGQSCDVKRIHCAPASTSGARLQSAWVARGSSIAVPAGRIVVGLSCKDGYCGKVRMTHQATSEPLTHCRWMDGSIRASQLDPRLAPLVLPDRVWVTGVRCEGSACARLTLRVCGPEPLTAQVEAVVEVEGWSDWFSALDGRRRCALALAITGWQRRGSSSTNQRIRCGPVQTSGDEQVGTRAVVAGDARSFVAPGGHILIGAGGQDFIYARTQADISHCAWTIFFNEEDADGITVPAGYAVRGVLESGRGGVNKSLFVCGPSQSDQIAGNAVQMFEDDSYGGKIWTGTGDVSDLKQVGFDDKASSVVLRGMTSAALYQHKDFQGKCMTVTGPEANFSATTIGHDQVSSVKVNAVCPGTSSDGHGLSLYADRRYSGKSITVASAVPDLATLGFNDTASSVRWAHASSAALYEDKHFQGKCLTVRGAVPNMGATIMGHDKVSSIKVGQVCPGTSSDGRGVQLFEHGKYRGKSVTVGAHTPRLDSLGMEDAASSVKLVGVGVAALFKHKHYKGTCVTVRGAIADLSTTRMGHDAVSSVKVDAACPGTDRTGNGVRLFEHDAYRGKYVTISSNLPDLKSLGFDNATSSVRLRGVRSAALYEHRKYKGRCLTVTSAFPNLGQTLMKHDKVSSVRLNSKCVGYGNGVTLYADSGFRGRAVSLGSHVANLDELAFDDKASSVRLSGARIAALYQHKNFAGTCETVTRDIANLGQTLAKHDRVSSVKVGAGCAREVSPRGAIVLWQHDSFRGRRVELSASHGNLKTVRMGDEASSVQLVNGATRAALWEHDNYRGRCVTVTGAIKNLKKKPWKFGDKASSVWVGRGCP